MHHRRRGLNRAVAPAVALLLVVGLGLGACSGDDGGSGDDGAGTTPTGSIVPGGSDPGAEPTESSQPGGGTGDPSAGLPEEQFCRGFGDARTQDEALADAIENGDLTAAKTAYRQVTVAYQTIAENPPDEVYDEARAAFFAYDDAAAQVEAATSLDDLTQVALQLQGGDAAEDLEVVRDYGAARC